jgi:hypothetical protein
MYLLQLFIFTTLFFHGRSSTISPKKICKDCIHCIGGDKLECRKFGDTDMVTGKVTYQSASHVRKDEKLCGEDAIHFEKNNFKMFTVPYYFYKDNWIALLPNGLIGLYILYLYYVLH